MTQDEWEQHPIFAVFVASVLDQLLTAGEYLHAVVVRDRYNENLVR